ncbi:DNA topoisomerase 3 [Ruminococcaceae bacterium OttesenSCG-928-I18]|nr:DNA topoisomerase 3 [Ruminococcaceae bacterium OttesenSCG-928-I18]
MSQHKLVIAEKPSVAAAIAKALGITERKDGYLQGGGYIISWCIGHLVGLANAAAYDEKYAKWRHDDLPIMPEEWKLVTGRDKAKQFDILKTLMHDKDVTSLVCATDAGREGELIFRLVYEQAGCTKPFERLWISSMEDAAIRSGFMNLKDGGEYDNLYASALCRAKADWLVGINATRLFTTIYNHKLNVGRVQSPTLAMLVERDAQIKGFQKEKYYHARIGCGGFEAASDRINDKEDAELAQDVCNGRPAAVVSVDEEHKTVNPPRLYDLTTLQREANRLYGYTAQQTLDLVQTLYEKKLCTYPRTDSQYLTGDMEDTARRVMATVIAKMDFAAGVDFTPDIGRVINNAKVTDHHAVIPTVELEKTDLAALPGTEREILSLISFKLLCAVAEPHIFESVTATLECGGYSFTAKGKSVLAGGWKAIEHRFKRMTKTEKEDTDTAEDAILPPLSDGQTFENVAASVTEHTTTPPKAYTEDTLLSAMESAGSDEVELAQDAEKKGLGTPATRASIIEKLVSSGFAERKKKQLLPTENGIKLITVLPDAVKSAKLTAEWENALTLIAKGQLSPDDFMNDIASLVKGLCITYYRADDDKKDLFGQAQEKEIIGLCPRCGNPVVEGKKNFYCQNRDCQFAMWKDDRFFVSKKKNLKKNIAAALLKDGKITVKGLYSEKSGKTYDATVLLADTGDKYVNYRLEFGK